MNQLLKVIRPLNPTLAVNVALLLQKLRKDNHISQKEFDGAFNGMIYLQGYKCIGFMRGKEILDDDGLVIGNVQPGDSFVTDIDTNGRSPEFHDKPTEN